MAIAPVDRDKNVRPAEIEIANKTDAIIGVIGAISHIRAGHFNASDVPANGYKDFEIAFSPALPRDVWPEVFCAIRRNGNESPITANVQTMNKEGFKLRVFNGTSSQLSPVVMWCAVQS